MTARVRAVGRRCRRFVAGLVGLSLLASVLTWCSATPQLGFRLAPDGRHVQVLVYPCKGSRMHAISTSAEVDPATHSHPSPTPRSGAAAHREGLEAVR